MEITLIGYESTANYLGLCKLKLFLFPTINSHYNLRFLYFFVALKPLVITNISAFLLFISMTKSYTWTIVLFQYVGSLICISGKLKAALHLCFFSYFSLSLSFANNSTILLCHSILYSSKDAIILLTDSSLMRTITICHIAS